MQLDERLREWLESFNIALKIQSISQKDASTLLATRGEPKSLWEIPEGAHAYIWAARLVDFFTVSLLK